MKWVKLVEFDSLQIAKFLEDMLMSQSIPCLLQGCHSNQIMSLHGVAISIQVQVREEDLEKAKEILKDFDQTQKS